VAGQGDDQGGVGDLGPGPEPRSPSGPRKDTDGEDVDAVHGVFVVVGVDGAVAAQDHLPLQRHLRLRRDKWVTPLRAPPTPKSTGPSPPHPVTHHPQAPDEHPLRGQQEDAGGRAGAQLGHGDEDDQEPRGDASQPVGQRQRRVAQAQPRHAAGTPLRTGESLSGFAHPKTPMGAIPTVIGSSRGARDREKGVTVSSTGLTQCPASAQHRGRQRCGTGPPSSAELSPTPGAWWDLGTWGRSGVGVRVRHGTPRFIPRWGPDSGHAVTSTFWITLPKGQRKYPARSQQSRPAGTRASPLLGTPMSPPPTGPHPRDGTQETP